MNVLEENMYIAVLSSMHVGVPCNVAMCWATTSFLSSWIQGLHVACPFRAWIHGNTVVPVLNPGRGLTCIYIYLYWILPFSLLFYL